MIIKKNTSKKNKRVLFNNKMLLLKKNTQLMSDGSILKISEPDMTINKPAKKKTTKKKTTKKKTQKKEE